MVLVLISAASLLLLRDPSPGVRPTDGAPVLAGPGSPAVTPGLLRADPDRDVPPGRDTGQAEDQLADNVLAGITLRDTTCPELHLPQAPVPDAELEAFLEAQIDCLTRVHTEPLAEAGIALDRPALAPESALARSGCIVDAEEHDDDWAGLYCGADNTIYFRTNRESTAPLHHVEVITHEFAHHLQQQTGLLARVSRAQAATETEPNGAARAQELSRRLELQAECLTGMAMSPEGPLAVRPSDFSELVNKRGAVPPEWAATHGTGRAQTRWFKAGAAATGPDRLAVCNTFAAPAELVD